MTDSAKIEESKISRVEVGSRSRKLLKVDVGDVGVDFNKLRVEVMIGNFFKTHQVQKIIATNFDMRKLLLHQFF